MSSKKKNGLKRNTPQYQQHCTTLQRHREYSDWQERTWGQTQAEQEILLALGRIGFRSRDYYKLHEALIQLRNEYSQLLREEFKDDPHCWHLKHTFDEELYSYVPESMRVSWDTRFIFDRHTPGLRIGPADNVPGEQDTFNKLYAEYLARLRMIAIKREANRNDKRTA